MLRKISCFEKAPQKFPILRTEIKTRGSSIQEASQILFRRIPHFFRYPEHCLFYRLSHDHIFHRGPILLKSVPENASVQQNKARLRVNGHRLNSSIETVVKGAK